MYTLINPKTGERTRCNSLAELINAWIAAPYCGMSAVGVPESERQAINNIYALQDQLRQAKRERISMSAAMMRRTYVSEQGVVL
jgi:hypothetical protein